MTRRIRRSGPQPLVARTGRHIDFAILAVLRTCPLCSARRAACPPIPSCTCTPIRVGLIRRAASTFEPDQFAGWVPHQQITYLWPSGPGSGCSTRWRCPIGSLTDSGSARSCSLPAGGPPVRSLSDIRCSACLLQPRSTNCRPTAALHLADLAAPPPLGGLSAGSSRRRSGPRCATLRRSRLDRWREPALIALIVATVGSANATALAMIVPAPAICAGAGSGTSTLPLGDADPPGITCRSRVALLCRFGGCPC